MNKKVIIIGCVILVIVIVIGVIIGISYRKKYPAIPAREFTNVEFKEIIDESKLSKDTKQDIENTKNKKGNFILTEGDKTLIMLSYGVTQLNTPPINYEIKQVKKDSQKAEYEIYIEDSASSQVQQSGTQKSTTTSNSQYKYQLFEITTQQNGIYLLVYKNGTKAKVQPLPATPKDQTGVYNGKVEEGKVKVTINSQDVEYIVTSTDLKTKFDQMVVGTTIKFKYLQTSIDKKTIVSILK